MVINPEGIPAFGGSPDVVETEGGNLIAAGRKLHTTGSSVHSKWQGLASFYRAPEAEKLFAATKPVKTAADDFGEEIVKVGQALRDYADDVRGPAKKLGKLKADAKKFVKSVEDLGDDAWADQQNVDRNNDLIHDVDGAIVAIQAAERRCANRIGKLYGRAAWVAVGDSKNRHTYGVKEIPENVKRPWGNPEEKRPGGVWEQLGGFFVGLFGDTGLWGDLTGLWNLAAFWNPEFGKSWNGLRLLIIQPIVNDLVDPSSPGYDSSCYSAWANVGKALIGWDDWAKGDWGRAAGTLTYNVVTLVGVPTKLAKMGRAGKFGAKGVKIVTTLEKLKVGRLSRLALSKLPKVEELVKAIKVTKGVKEFVKGVDNFRNALDDLPAKLQYGRQIAVAGGPPMRIDSNLGDLLNHSDDAPKQSHVDNTNKTTTDGPTLSKKTDPEVVQQVANWRNEVASELQEFADEACKDTKRKLDEALNTAEYHEELEKVVNKWIKSREDKLNRPLTEVEASKVRSTAENVYPKIKLGRDAHTHLANAIKEAVAKPTRESAFEKLSSEAHYRIRSEVNFDILGNETTRATNNGFRPDIILERKIGKNKWEAVHAYDFKTGKTGIASNWSKTVKKLLKLNEAPELLRPQKLPMYQ